MLRLEVTVEAQTQASDPGANNAQKAEEKVPPELRSKPKLVTVTLSVLGPNLPLGTVDPSTGGTQKLLEHRPWNLRTEKRLGTLREQKRSTTMGQFGAMVLGSVCSRIGALTFDEKKITEQWARVLLDIGQMWLGDALYAYVWLRCECIGYDFSFKTQCPRCGKKLEANADLRNLEVHTALALADTQWTYKLRDPFTARGKTIDALLMGPCRWSAIESVSAAGGLNLGTVKSTLLWSSIHGVPVLDGAVLAESELEEMSKRDLETLSDLVNSNNLGPDMAIELECDKPGCRNVFKQSIDWTYDSFFSVSSR